MFLQKFNMIFFKCEASVTSHYFRLIFANKLFITCYFIMLKYESLGKGLQTIA